MKGDILSNHCESACIREGHERSSGIAAWMVRTRPRRVRARADQLHRQLRVQHRVVFDGLQEAAVALDAIGPSLWPEEHVGDRVGWRHRATEDEECGTRIWADGRMPSFGKIPARVRSHEILLLKMQELAVVQYFRHTLLQLPCVSKISPIETHPDHFS